MARLWLALLLAVAAPSLGTTEPCRPIAGLDPLLRPGTVLLLGEIHGTAESPAFVGDVACQVARAGLAVVVALELPVGEQPRIDAFLDADGSDAARGDLLAGRSWQRSYQDGRNSVAMLQLIERLGRLRRGGAAARIVLFDTGTAAGGQARDHAMAERLAELAAAEGTAVTVVLTGNLHSRTDLGRPGNADYAPMGQALTRLAPATRVVALREAHGGGSAWVCSPRCGVAGLGGRRGERPWAVEIGVDPPPGHDGWYRIGGITASPPARLSAAERAALRRAAPAASAPPSPPGAKHEAADPPPQGPLSVAERSFLGRWQGFDHRRGFRTWSLDVEGRAFRAEGAGEWYEGRLVVVGDREPGWIDFVIERCRCAYEGGTSKAVFGWDGELLLVNAPAPGNPRPDELAPHGAQLIRFERR